jgi:PAS domain S-box-containing protein
MIGKNSKVKKIKPAGSSGAALKKAKAGEILRCPEIVLDNISDSIVQLDLHNRVLWANRAATVMLGREPKDIIGRQCYKLWGRTPADCQDCPTVLARKTGAIQTKEMISKDGRIWQVSSHPVKGDKGKVVSVVEVSREITKIKRALEQETKLLQDKGAISETALQLAKTSDVEQIFKLIGQGIHKLAGNAVATVSSFDSSDSTLTLREIAGSPASLKKISEVLGKNTGPLKLQNIPPRVIKKFRMGRLMTLEGGLTEAFLGNLPSRMINALSSGLGIQQVYGMGLYCGQNILGTIIICQLDKKAGLNHDLIENFINQAAMALSRVKAEKEIKYSQDYFKSIIDNTSEIITILDSEGVIKFKSLSAAHELGYQPEELTGRNVFDFIHPEDVPGLIAKFNQELHNIGKKIRLELRFRHKDGSWQTLDATSINLLDNPSVNGLVISSRNITQRNKSELALKQSESGLKESRRKLETLMGNLPGMVYRCRNDRDWTMEITNQGCRELTGYDPVDIIDNKTVSFTRLIHPADREMVWGDIQIAVQKKKAYQLIYRIIARDGAEKWVWEQGQGVFDEKGALQALEGFIADISERKRAEDALHASEYQYRSTIDSLADSIHVVDAKLSIMLTNRVFKEWNKKLGLASEAVGRNIFEIYPFLPRENVTKEYKQVFDGGRVLVTVEENSVNNSRIITETRKIPIFENEKVVRVITVVRDITESKLASEALRETEEMYRGLIEATNTGFVIIDAAGRVQDANAEYVRLAGHRTLKEIMGRPVTDWTAPHDLQRNRDEIEKCLRGGAVRMLEIDYQHPDGTIIPVEINATVVQRASGPAILTLCRDITGRKLVEEAVRQSQERYQTLAEASPEMIYVVDGDARVSYVNSTGAKTLGQGANDIIGRRLSDIFPALIANRQWTNLQKVFNSGESLYLESQTPFKGEILWLDTWLVPIRDRQNKVISVMGLSRNITERKEIEARLYESEKNYRQIFDGVAEGIYRSTPEGKVLLVNPALVRMLGYSSEEELMRRDITREGYSDIKTRQLFLDQIEKEGHIKDQASQWLRRDGSVITVRENAHAVKDHSGKTLYYEGTVEDITEQIKAEEEIRSSELKYRMLMDQANDAIFVGDPETGKLVDANLKAQQLIGRTLDEILKMNQAELHPADQNKRYQEIFRQHIKDGKAILPDLVVVHKDGRQIPVEISANLVEVRGRKLLQGIFHDLSERQGMESALKESEEKYRQIFEGISEGIYRSTPDGKLLFANPSLIRMLGYKNPEDVQGLDLNSTVYLDKKTRARFIKQIEQNGEVMGFEAEMVTKGGAVLAVSENARLVKDRNGRPLYYEGTLEDVTVRKRAEMSLKSEKDKLEHLFKVGLSVARAQTLQEKLDLTLKGIADCRLFRKAVIVLEDNGYRSHIAQYGLRPEEVENIEKSPVNDAQHKSKIFLNKYRRSNSYFIPHGDAEVHKYFAARFVSQDYKSNGTWHREDVLIVPLAIKGINVGFLSVDEPWDGNIPAIETVHLLELFANQAAIAVENIRLYNDLERSYYDTLKAFVAAMDAKDPYTKGHSENVRHYALKIARHIGLPEDRLRLIDYSSLLHDIGKLGIREDILAKPDVLSTVEFQEVKLHPVIGSRLVLEIDALSQTGDVIYCHHEYYDGSGYPRGIKGDAIPLEARIIAVADAFEAMTSDRPYRKAFSFQVALQRLQDAAGTQFDHKIVNAFTELFRRESGLREGQ